MLLGLRQMPGGVPFNRGTPTINVSMPSADEILRMGVEDFTERFGDIPGKAGHEENQIQSSNSTKLGVAALRTQSERPPGESQGFSLTAFRFSRLLKKIPPS